jgi:NADH-quinone oxidoreductase subunit L
VSDPIGLALLILGLPLAATLLAAVFSRSVLRTAANWPLILSCAAASVLALVLLARVADDSVHRFLSEPVTWFAAGRVRANFAINVDPLSAIMLAMITFVSTWIAIYSSGYMKGEVGYARFFAVMGLFVFSMCGLVLANNFLLLVAFWEGVGLCSYLLIGYYFEKPSAAAAARKAFLVTRIGDTGFVLGIFLLWKLGGWHTDLTALFDYIAKNPPDQASLTTACLLLFCGAVGKSAQFPLYVWLPDAMEGPSPVSALIHAATMVTAGVYLLARCAPLFARCPEATLVVAWIGGLTALLAAFIALAQTDLKRILAYSTVSQLGFMFLALGTMGPVSPVFAVTAAIFHLFTHAFFKALLFLSAGSVMHAMGGVIDVRRFGGLRKLMPITHVTFLCGAMALAGFPLLSGYWSKDLVLESLSDAGRSQSTYSASYFVLVAVAFLTAFLTAFYTFRAYCLTFWGELRLPPEAGHHAHESPGVMTIPLIVLAVGALLIGAVVEPFTHWFSGFLGQAPSLSRASSSGAGADTIHHFNWTIAIASALLALAGAGLACALYRNGAEEVPRGLEGVHSLSGNRVYVEDLYEATIVRPVVGLSFLTKVFDGFLDGLARLVSTVPRFLAALARPIQNGLVQFYALSMALGLVVLLSFVVFRVAR